MAQIRDVYEEHVRIARVVGESEEGLTLFVPKSMEGVFNLTEGDQFLTFIFVKDNPRLKRMEPWLPWEG